MVFTQYGPIKAIAKLTLILVVIPLVLVCLHLKDLLRRERFVLVSSPSPTSNTFGFEDTQALNPDGIYHPTSRFDNNYRGDYIRIWQSRCNSSHHQKENQQEPDDQLCKNFHWPTITQLSYLLRVLSNRSNSVEQMFLSPQTLGRRYRVHYQTETNEWVLLMDKGGGSDADSKPIPIAYSPRLENNDAQLRGEDPPSGTWTQRGREKGYNSDYQIQVVSYGRSTQRNDLVAGSSVSVSSSTSYGFRRNPDKRYGSSTNKSGFLYRHIFEQPATTFWITLNVGLFIFYWNQSVSPATVALNNAVWKDHGRAFSGALAHFEIWHLGFNMMSLSALGQELERPDKYGSISFFLYTLSLIPITTLLLLTMSTLYLRHHQRRQPEGQDTMTPMEATHVTAPNQNIVGFSGVLFAWMVVATLQPTKGDSCPIPFFPDLCFSTYKLPGGLSFNFGPFAQLVFAQVILPRACFMGHLAGILAGFAIHWNFLSLEFFAQPSIIIPATWIYSKLLKQEQTESFNLSIPTSRQFWSKIVLPFRRQRLTSNHHEDNMEVTTHTSALSAPVERLFWVYSIMLVLLVAIVASQQFNSILLSHILVCSVLHCMLCSIADEGDTSNSRFGMIGRGLLVILVILIVTDSMTIGGWVVTRKLWEAQASLFASVLSITPMYLKMVPLLLFTRLIILMLMLCLTSFQLANLNETGSHSSIFVRIFGWTVLEPARLVGQQLVPKQRDAPGRFPGRGEALGGRTNVTTV